MSGSLKLIALIEKHADPIARAWAKDVCKNSRTASYHDMPEDKLVPLAIRFYDNFRKMFYAEKPAEVSREFFARYAEEQYEAHVPLHEAIYALILMRRHIWLYAEFQVIFITAVEQKQAVDSLVRTILMFDYAITFMSQRYQELIRGELNDRLALLNMIRLESPLGTRLSPYRTAIMTVLLIGSLLLTYYYHAMMGSNVIFTHLFYIPVVLAGIWWKRKGILLAVVLGVFLILSHLVFLGGIPITDDFVRAVMFIVIGAVVAFLSEGITMAEEIYRLKAM
ncbi:MAG TPA: hypothetical protein PLO63_15690 [Syntrophales bacterium]|jgi:hypothetical protein|nr:hypothetical protein [Syntrophales bacterium]